ncbi:MAG: Rpn family recombination-promoting nuclease/putative transposase [Eubacterium sp.]|nr:Rpn family recombination-promoting nuclease/putative transposase [Eubacterium sp.]
MTHGTISARLRNQACIKYNINLVKVHKSKKNREKLPVIMTVFLVHSCTKEWYFSTNVLQIESIRLKTLLAYV